eukprot:SAG31_NODE_3165_length_4601_cov_2.917814_1_plen_170_part_00
MFRFSPLVGTLATHLPARASHTRTDLSADVDASNSLCVGSQVSWSTASLCPFSSWSLVPLLFEPKCQMMTLLSALPDARRLPSAFHATVCTFFECPSRPDSGLVLRNQAESIGNLSILVAIAPSGVARGRRSGAASGFCASGRSCCAPALRRQNLQHQPPSQQATAVGL